MGKCSRDKCGNHINHGDGEHIIGNKHWILRPGDRLKTNGAFPHRIAGKNSVENT